MMTRVDSYVVHEERRLGMPRRLVTVQVADGRIIGGWDYHYNFLGGTNGIPIPMEGIRTVKDFYDYMLGLGIPEHVYRSSLPPLLRKAPATFS